MALYTCPKLVILTGPSGAGKTEIKKGLMEHASLGLKELITCTTRPPRPKEAHGRDYFFYSREEFEKMIARNEMLEYAEVYGDLYGSRMQDVDSLLQKGHSPIFVLDVQGASTIMKKYSSVVSLFIKTPSIEDLEKLLRGRGTDSPERIARRLGAAPQELAREKEFPNVIVNHVGKLEDTIVAVSKIVYYELVLNREISRRR